MNDIILQKIASKVSQALINASLIQVEVSAKHVHLSQADYDILFGKGTSLTPIRELSQPGQFLSEERVTLIGKKGRMERVAVLGPVRTATQVELSISDSIALGVTAPLRESGDVDGSGSITIEGRCGSITIPEGVIVASRHVHITPNTAKNLGLADKDLVSVEVITERPVLFRDVLVRVSSSFCDRMHIDFDEANSAMVKGFTLGKIIK